MGPSTWLLRKTEWRQYLARGQGLVEYALILVSVAIVVIAILAFIGAVVKDNMYSKITSGFVGP